MAFPDFKTPSTIRLKGRGGKWEERPAFDGNIKPGHALIGNADGTWRKNNATSGTDNPVIVALENSLGGQPITVAYTTGTTVFGYIAEKGDRLYVRVPASATAIVADDSLQMDAGGCFILQTGAGIPVVKALESLDNSAGGSEAFIRVEVK